MKTLARLVAASALALSVNAQAGSLYFFGDSLSDTGNTSAALGGAVPVITANTPYQPGQYTDKFGAGVWSSQFATMMGQPGGATFSLAGGTNFSFAAARTYSAGAGTPAGASAPQVPGLDQQIGMYLGTGHAATAGDLFVVMIGGNDIQQIAGIAGAAGQAAAAAAAAVPGATPTQIQNAFNAAFGAAVGQGVQTGLGNITSAINTLITQNGARHFLVANMPDVAATPYVQSLGANTVFGVNAVVSAWNSMFMSSLLNITPAAGLDVDVLDIFGLGTTMASSFSNSTDPCFVMQKTTQLQDCTKYAYSDDFHPTAAAHTLIAQAAVRAVPLPGSLALLGLGMLCAVAVRRKSA